MAFCDKPPERAVRQFFAHFVEHAGLQVVRDQSEHLAAHILAVYRMHVQAIEKGRRWRHALLFVVHRPDPAVDERRGCGLSEVVRYRPKHDDELIGAIEIADPLARLIDDLQRVHPDVSLRVPLGLLNATHERFQLWKELIDHTQFQRERETNGRALGPEKQFFDLAPDPFGRQVVEADRSAERFRVGVRASARIARQTESREARGGCRRRTSSGSTALRILLSRSRASVGRVEVFVGQRIP